MRLLFLLLTAAALSAAQRGIWSPGSVLPWIFGQQQSSCGDCPDGKCCGSQCISSDLACCDDTDEGNWCSSSTAVCAPCPDGQICYASGVDEDGEEDGTNVVSSFTCHENSDYSVVLLDRAATFFGTLSPTPSPGALSASVVPPSHSVISKPLSKESSARSPNSISAATDSVSFAIDSLPSTPTKTASHSSPRDSSPPGTTINASPSPPGTTIHASPSPPVTTIHAPPSPPGTTPPRDPSPPRTESHAPPSPPGTTPPRDPSPPRTESHAPPSPPRTESHAPPSPPRTESHAPPKPPGTESHAPPKPPGTKSHAPPNPPRTKSHAPPSPPGTTSHASPRDPSPPGTKSHASPSPPGTASNSSPRDPGPMKTASHSSPQDAGKETASHSTPRDSGPKTTSSSTSSSKTSSTNLSLDIITLKVSPLYTTASSSHSPLPLYTGSGPLLTGYCTQYDYSLVSGPQSTALYYIPIVGCAGDKPDCCPFPVSTSTTSTVTKSITTSITISAKISVISSVTVEDSSPESTSFLFPTPESKAQATLRRCPQDYETVSSGCCPSGYQLWNGLLGGVTPCYSSLSSTTLVTPRAATPSTAAAPEKTLEEVVNFVYAMHYPINGAQPRLTTPELAGIGIGSAFAVLVVAWVIFLVYRMRRPGGGWTRPRKIISVKWKKTGQV